MLVLLCLVALLPLSLCQSTYDCFTTADSLPGFGDGVSDLGDCPVGCASGGVVFGTNPFSSDSAICRAAVFAGMFPSATGGTITVFGHPDLGAYVGGNVNSVLTFASGPTPFSFSFSSGFAASPSPTPVSITASRTSSETPSLSRSSSPTISDSNTATRSMTPSRTPAGSQSASASLVSVSPTLSETSSMTRSLSGSKSSSITGSPTRSRTTSPTPLSATQSPTSTISRSLTSSITESTTRTPTSTSSLSGSQSVSSTSLVSSTRSETRSRSFSASTSATPSVSSSPPIPSPEYTGCGTPPHIATGSVVSVDESSYVVDCPTVPAQTRPATAAVGAYRIVMECTNLRFWSAAPARTCQASASCTGDGGFLRNGACIDCPTGAFCPGGDRIWAQVGYWSPDELTVPLACRSREACPGAVAPLNGTTTRCGAGYFGSYCSKCDTGYYRSQDSCLPCPPNPTVALASLAAGAAILFSIIAAGVVLLPHTILDVLVAGVVAFQQATLLSRTGASYVANSLPGLATVLNYVSVFSFDVQFSTAECNTGELTYTHLLWATVAMIVIVAVLFVLASGIRACVLVLMENYKARRQRDTTHKRIGSGTNETELQSIDSADLTLDRARTSSINSVPTNDTSVPHLDGSVPSLGASTNALAAPEEHDGTVVADYDEEVQMTDVFRDDVERNKQLQVRCHQHFLRRSVRSLLILGTIVYLQLCTRVFQGLACIRDPTDPSRLLLKAELSTVCYQGSHEHAAAFIWLLLFLYLIGYPTACFVMLLRFYRAGRIRDRNVLKMWGYIHAEMRPQFFWFQLLDFPVTFLITAVTLAADESAARSFTSGLVFDILAMTILFAWPYRKRWHNILFLLLSLAKGCIALATIANSYSDSPFLQGIIVITVLMALVIVVRVVWDLSEGVRDGVREAFAAIGCTCLGKPPPSDLQRQIAKRKRLASLQGTRRPGPSSDSREVTNAVFEAS